MYDDNFRSIKQLLHELALKSEKAKQGNFGTTVTNGNVKKDGKAFGTTANPVKSSTTAKSAKIQNGKALNLTKSGTKIKNVLTMDRKGKVIVQGNNIKSTQMPKTTNVGTSEQNSGHIFLKSGKIGQKDIINITRHLDGHIHSVLKGYPGIEAMKPTGNASGTRYIYKDKAPPRKFRDLSQGNLPE